jgi:hypothetical protein
MVAGIAGFGGGNSLAKKKSLGKIRFTGVKSMRIMIL